MPVKNNSQAANFYGALLLLLSPKVTIVGLASARAKELRLAPAETSG